MELILACLVCACIVAAFFGVGFLLSPLIEFVPAPSSARFLLLLLWTFFFLASGWGLSWGCLVESAGFRSSLRWVFYGWLGTLGASISLLAAYALVGHVIPRDWQFVFGMFILLIYGHVIFLPTFQWLLDKHAANR